MRAFLAVELDAAVRDHISTYQRQLRGRLDVPGARRRSRVSWTAPQTMHLTVKFLGEIEDSAAETLRHALQPGLGSIQPFTIPLRRLGAFPSARDPRALWVGPPQDWSATEDSHQLRALHGAVEAACARIGAERDDRPFSPHLTIARVRDGGREAGRTLTADGAFDAPLGCPPLAVREIVLFKSVLGQAAAVHTRLWAAEIST